MRFQTSSLMPCRMRRSNGSKDGKVDLDDVHDLSALEGAASCPRAKRCGLYAAAGVSHGADVGRGLGRPWIAFAQRIVGTMCAFSRTVFTTLARVELVSFRPAMHQGDDH